MRETPDEVRENTPPAIGASPVAGPSASLVRVITSPWGEKGWLRVYAAAIVMAIFLSFLGALGTHEAPLLTRIGYWLPTLLGGTAAVQLVSLASCRFIRLEPLAGAIILFLLSLPAVTLTVWVIDALFDSESLQAQTLVRLIGPVAIVTFAMSALQYLLERNPRQSHTLSETAQTEPAGAFRERLPFRYKQADIHALSAEDHYLRVYTSAGQTLILMRFYDAIRELDGIEGSQVHRSWWVARSAVRDVMRRDGRVTLRIEGGMDVPVSRSYARPLRAKGWLQA